MFGGQTLLLYCPENVDIVLSQQYCLMVTAVPGQVHRVRAFQRQNYSPNSIGTTLRQPPTINDNLHVHFQASSNDFTNRKMTDIYSSNSIIWGLCVALEINAFLSFSFVLSERNRYRPVEANEKRTPPPAHTRTFTLHTCISGILYVRVFI